MARTLIEGFLSQRCWHRWEPRQSTAKAPKICPKCKSAY